MSGDTASDGLLQPFGPNIWTTDGGIVSVAGFHYPTRMAVIRLADGALFIWSPTAISDALCAEIDRLGVVRFIVPPNSLHHLSLAGWRSAYPGAKLFAPPGLRKKRADLSFDADLGDAAYLAWAGQVDQVMVRGNAITVEIAFFHRESGVVLFADLIQNFPKGWFKGWRGLVAKLDRLTAPEAEVPQKFRVAFSDRKAARASLVQILAWPAQKVLMAHGPLIQQDGAAFLRRAFSWLMR